MNYFQRLPGYQLFLTILGLWLAAGLIAWSCMVVPKLNSSQEDEEENSRQIQRDREKLNNSIGLESFQRLDEKYGNHD